MAAVSAHEVRAYVFGQWAFEPRRLLDVLTAANVAALADVVSRLADVADPGVRAEALSLVERRLRGEPTVARHEELPPIADVAQALANARRLVEPYSRASALATAATLLWGDAREATLDEALAAASDIPSEHWRAVARAQVARVGSPGMVRRVLEDSLRLESSQCRLHALVDVLPYAPHESRGEVVSALLSASWETGDSSAVQHALPRTAGLLTTDVFDRALEGASRLEQYQRVQALEALAPHLTAAQARRQLDALPELESYARTRLIEIIAPRLSPDAADWALQLLGEPRGDEWQQRNWADAAAALAPQLSPVGAARLLPLVRALPDGYARAKLVVGIAIRPPPTEPALQLALAAISAVDWGYWRNELLFHLLPILPDVFFPPAIEIVRETADPRQRVEGVLLLVDRVPDAQRTRLLDSAVVAAGQIQGDSERADAFIKLGPRLTEQQLLLALQACERMTAWAAWRLLAGLASYLRGAVLERGLELAQQLEPGEFQAQALLAIAMQLDEPRRSTALLQSVRSAQLGSVHSAAHLAAELAEHVALALLPDVLSLARSVRWSAERAGALLAVAEHLTGPPRSAVLLEALAAARAIATPAARSERAAALAEIARLSPEPERAQLFAEAVIAACAWENSEARNGILSAIAERYGPEPSLAALETLLPLDDRPAQYSAARLATDLPALALDDQRSILEQALELCVPDTRITEDGWTHRWKRLAESPQPLARPPAYLWIIRWRPGQMGPGPGDSGLAFVAPTRPPPRVVNTGFASSSSPAEAVDPSNSLLTGQSYYFWLEVGPPVAASIEVNPTVLPEELPPESQLTVAVFGFGGEIQVFPGGDVGELTLHADGTVDVARQPTEVSGISADSWLVHHRLFFPIGVPERSGTYRLRCCIYHRGLLVQSRLVSVRVTRSGSSSVRALRSVLDYSLASRLEPARLAQFASHDLSLMFNTEDGSSHGLRVFSGSGDVLFKSDAIIDAELLDKMIGHTRGALQRASWGQASEWQPGQAFLYAGPRNVERLKTDLIRFAIWGYRLYDVLINRLAGGYSAAKELGEIMRQHRIVQIALKHARLVVPAALIYDRPLDTNGDQIAICADFARAIRDGEPLAALACFAGDCSSRDDDTVVCPGGFWGYRHALGMPVSIASAPDAPGSIPYSVMPEVAVSVSTDPDLVERVAHEHVLRGLRSELGWSYADTRARTLQLLKNTRAHLVYFYCHGGVQNNIPYILVGYQENGITRDNIRSKKIRWDDPRPLVFINGCYTTAVRPEIALEFVSAFIENAWASGVVGTEITIFEPLARRFAEVCLGLLLNGVPIGEAVRQARLALLEEANPLGLVYIPFAVASLQLVATASNGTSGVTGEPAL